MNTHAQHSPHSLSSPAAAPDHGSSAGASTSAHAPGAADATTTPGSGQHVEQAGAFDIRFFIGLLIGVNGLILTLLGLFAFTEHEAAKTDGMNANLWVGLGMLAFFLLMWLWAKVDPIRMVVSDNEPGAEEPKDIAAI